MVAFEVATSSPLFRVTGVWSTFSKTVLAFFISWMSASFTNRHNLSNSVFIVYWPLDFFCASMFRPRMLSLSFSVFLIVGHCWIFSNVYFFLFLFSLFLFLLSPYLNDFNQLQNMHLFMLLQFSKNWKLFYTKNVHLFPTEALLLFIFTNFA